MNRRAWVLAVLAGAFATAAVERAMAVEVTTVAALERLSPVSVWEDTVVWSAYDSGIEAYRLTASHDGTVTTLAVEPLPIPFDADVGPNSSGDAAIVYSRCEDPDRYERERADCDLFIYSLRAGEERPIRNANSDASEFEPTLWRGEVAWARAHDGKSSRPFVYRRPLVAPRNRRSERLPGVPTRNCDQDLAGSNDCVTSDRRVEDLELYGRWLALRAEYSYEETYFNSPITELRLSDLRGGETEGVDLAADFGYDSAGFSVAALAGGHLMWHSSGSSGSSQGGNSYANTIRRRLSTGRNERLRLDESDQRNRTGFAATSSSIYRVGFDGLYEIDNIALERFDDLQWTRP